MHIIRPEEIIFSEKGKNLNWAPFTDQVVGGLSNASIVQHSNYIAFHGNIKPISKKGWAGLRSRKEFHDLSSYNFIEIKIKTDGQPYKFQIEYDGAWQADKLSTTIDIVKNQWSVMHLDMSKFEVYNFLKGTVPTMNHHKNKWDQVQRYNILLQSEEPKEFSFEIEYIRFH